MTSYTPFFFSSAVLIRAFFLVNRNDAGDDKEKENLNDASRYIAVQCVAVLHVQCNASYGDNEKVKN